MGGRITPRFGNTAGIRRIALRIIFSFYALVIIIFPYIVSSGTSHSTFPWDNFWHFSAYLLLPLFLYLAFLQDKENPYFLIILFGILWGFTDESLQRFSPHRFFEIKDLILDFWGVGMGGWLVFILRELKGVRVWERN